MIRCRCPRRYAADGQRHVGPLVAQAPVELGPHELRLADRDCGLDPLRNGVHRHPRLAVPYLAERELECALPAEVLDPHRLDPVRRRRGVDRRVCSLLERLDVHGTFEASK